MKAKTTSKKEFVPFDLIINVETRREAEFLWAFFNTSLTSRCNFANSNINSMEILEFSTKEKDINTSTIWRAIDESININTK